MNREHRSSHAAAIACGGPHDQHDMTSMMPINPSPQVVSEALTADCLRNPARFFSTVPPEPEAEEEDEAEAEALAETTQNPAMPESKAEGPS